jgi:hypothetical protein
MKRTAPLFAHVVLAVALTPPLSACAQSTAGYSAKPIRMIVPLRLLPDADDVIVHRVRVEHAALDRVLDHM